MKRIVLMIAAAVLALTGCGASSSSPSVATSMTAQAESAAESKPTPTQPPSQPPQSAPTAQWKPGQLPQFEAPEAGTPIVTLHTSAGDIKLMMFPQAAPLAVENFVSHCKSGFYDGVIFHRVLEDFMIQSGDPLGNGTGGQSIWNAPFADEFSDHLHNFRGALSMANSGIGTNGSQFFIVQEDAKAYPDSAYRVNDTNENSVLLTLLQNEEVYKGTLQMTEKAKASANQAELDQQIDAINAAIGERLSGGLTEADHARWDAALEKYKEVGGTPMLDYKHTVFGQVIEGMDVVDAIAKAKVVANAQGEVSKPAADIVIQSTTVEIAK